MHRAFSSIGPAAVLALAGCNSRDASAPAAKRDAVAQAASDTGGSRKGDFGPPQSEPVKAVLTSPANVPPATNRSVPAKVIVELEVIEKEMPISEGVGYTFLTFGGTVPGSFIRVRQDDTVEFLMRVAMLSSLQGADATANLGFRCAR